MTPRQAALQKVIDEITAHWRENVRQLVAGGGERQLRDLMKGLMGQDQARFLREQVSDHLLAVIAEMAGTQLGIAVQSLSEEDGGLI